MLTWREIRTVKGHRRYNSASWGEDECVYHTPKDLPGIGGMVRGSPKKKKTVFILWGPPMSSQYFMAIHLINSGSFTKNKMSCSWWLDRKNQDITKVIKIHPPGTMNGFKILIAIHPTVKMCHWQPKMSPSWWDFSSCHGIRKISLIHPLGTLNVYTKFQW